MLRRTDENPRERDVLGIGDELPNDAMNVRALGDPAFVAIAEPREFYHSQTDHWSVVCR